MRHVLDLLLGVVDGRDNRRRKLFEKIGKPVLFRRGFAGASAALSLRGNATVGIESTKCSVALLENTTTFFDKRLDVVDELLFIKLVTWSTVSLLNVLKLFKLAS